MTITDIICPCGNNKGFYHSDNLADCTSCNTAVHVDIPVYHTYNVKPLHQIAKEQALKDILIMGSFDMNGDIIDWANCFDTSNITNKIDMRLCDCTAPQVDEDKMCICGLPITVEDNWTNDSGYSDVFH